MEMWDSSSVEERADCSDKAVLRGPVRSRSLEPALVTDILDSPEFVCCNEGPLAMLITLLATKFCCALGSLLQHASLAQSICNRPLALVSILWAV